MRIVTFDLPDCENCGCGGLDVYDGSTHNDPLVGRFCRDGWTETELVFGGDSAYLEYDSYLLAPHSGFEIYYEAPDEYLDRSPGLSEQIGDRDYCISFRWGGDMAECASVLIASAALADSFDAVIHYPDDDQRVFCGGNRRVCRSRASSSRPLESLDGERGY